MDPCTSCGLNVIDGVLTLALGERTCEDINDSDAVFCGPDGVLSVPKSACALPLAVVSHNYMIDQTLTTAGETYVVPDAEISSLNIPENTSSCQNIEVDLFIDWTTTMTLTATDLPQCLPSDCDDIAPPPPIAVVEIHYETRTDGGTWVGLFSDFIATSGVSGSNFHQGFVQHYTQAPGDLGKVIDFRVRYVLPANHDGTVQIAGYTLLARTRAFRMNPC